MLIIKKDDERNVSSAEMSWLNVRTLQITRHSFACKSRRRKEVEQSKEKGGLTLGMRESYNIETV